MVHDCTRTRPRPVVGRCLIRATCVGRAWTVKTSAEGNSTIDMTLIRLPLACSRKTGDPNPYATDRSGVGNSLTMPRECALARRAAL